LTEIVGNDVATVHLCSQCAAERGIETGASAAQTPLGAFLAAMGTTGTSIPLATASPEICAGCGATLQDFRASGRIGCGRCWITFESTLRDLVRRLHGATQHTGTTYTAPGVTSVPGDASDHSPGRDGLRDALRAAVDAEEFERAAELRDQLRNLGPE
jgi:protein arginine kinase activator